MQKKINEYNLHIEVDLKQLKPPQKTHIIRERKRQPLYIAGNQRKLQTLCKRDELSIIKEGASETNYYSE